MGAKKEIDKERMEGRKKGKTEEKTKGRQTT
jgi:hypothetical protein